jgi:putative nucleotidyltransferase with HDIG domain|tara:strand:+ start:80 stop:565 length:486 start_codon:yes stop_codon:yes gene_type:complete
MSELKIPTKEECIEILTKNKTPSNVIEHSKTVCEVAENIAENLINKSIKVNKELVIASALLHDIKKVEENHVVEGAKLLKSMGFPEVSEVARKHSLYQIEDENIQPKTVEEKIIFYADKRVKGNKIVSLEERFEDIKKRYKRDFSKELELAKKIEDELLKD